MTAVIFIITSLAWLYGGVVASGELAQRRRLAVSLWFMLLAIVWELSRLK